MPLTFPSHAAAVLPLKVWQPRWFDGVALVLGSTAPDLLYVIDGFLRTRYVGSGHSAAGWFWWCLPATLLGVRLTRWAAPTVAAHLPPWFRDYGVLGLVRHRWWVTVYSALLGAFSHSLWDDFTHRHGWFVHLLDLRTHVGGAPAYWLLQHLSTLVGGLCAAAFLVEVGRRGLLRRWHGAPPEVRTNPRRFWTVALVVGGLLAAANPFLPAFGAPNAVGVRLLVAAAVGLLAGTVGFRTCR